MQNVFRLLLVVFFALFLQTTVMAAEISAAQGADNPVFKRAVELYRQGRIDEAFNTFRDLAFRADQPEFSLRAHYYMARIFYDRKELQKALNVLAGIPDLDKTPSIWLLQGAALVRSGSAAQGLSVLRGVNHNKLCSTERLFYLQAMMEGNIRENKPLPALYFIQAALFLSEGEKRADLLETARRIFRKKTDSATLNEAGFMFQNLPLGDFAAMEKAKRLHTMGNRVEALRQLSMVLKNPSDTGIFREAEKAYLEMTGEAWAPRTIGVILPLSGQYASFGRLVKRGIEMALVAGLEANKRGAHFVFKDSGADAEKARQAVYELSADHQVMGIIGPIFGSAALAAARVAQQERIPLLTLSPRQGLPQIGDFVFRNSMTTTAQVDMLIQYAVVDQGMRRFAVLYPENRMGKEFASSFISRLKAAGGELAANQSYSEKATDFQVPIKLLLGLDPNAHEAKNISGNNSGGKDSLGFDALFIPDHAERAGLLVSQLAYYGIENVQLLGIGGWNNPELSRIAGRFVEGAVFPDGFFVYSPYLFVRDFVDRFKVLHQQEPSILDAQGFDAGNIVLTLIADGQVRTREELRQAMQGLQNYPGVTGATSFNTQGEAEKVLYLLQVKDGNFEQVN